MSNELNELLALAGLAPIDVVEGKEVEEVEECDEECTESEETVEEAITDEMSDEVDVESYFPSGEHGTSEKETGVSSAKHGDNGLQKSTKVSEEIQSELASKYRKFLGE